MKLFIVRHVETVGNIEKRLTGRNAYDITENGYRTIENLEQYLTNVKIDKIYSSPLKRAVETVLSIANKNSVDIEICEDLIEMYFGIYDGWRWEDVNSVNPNIKEKQIETNEIMGIENQETTEQVADRMYRKIQEIADGNSGKTVLIASHGVAIEAFLRRITGEPFSVKRDEYDQRNGSINELEYDNDKRVFSINKLNNYQYQDKYRDLLEVK
jgi:probable phosphoglycerate mutase